MSTSLPFENSHAFIIGNDAYEHISRLKTAVKDAKDISALLRGPHKYQIHELYNGTKAQMEEMLRKMPTIVQPKDRVIFYYAGHGIAKESMADPQGYLVPVDAAKSGTESLLSMDLLRDILHQLTCTHGLLILDCCFAGSFKWSTGFRSLFVREKREKLYEERFEQFVKSPAWQVITSSAHDQKALDVIQHDSLGLRNLTPDNNSPFAKALKEAIAEKTALPAVSGPSGDGVITATELYSLVRRKVEKEARNQHTRQSPALFTMSKHSSKGEYIFLEPGHILNLEKAPDRNPYNGLKAYQLTEEDARTFFGRRKAIQMIARKLEKTHTLVVSAPSGQGKSSTILAGLFPYLMDRNAYTKDQFLILRPGDKQTEIWQELEGIDPTQKKIVYIDQYEEIFTEAGEKKKLFESLLLGVCKKLTAYVLEHPTSLPPLKLIMSLRSDFEWKLIVSSVGQEFWSEALIRTFLYRLPPMELDELYEAAVKPAWVIAYEFEKKLIDQILEEIHHAPGALPLLSFALSKLYQYRDPVNRLFTQEAYEKQLGGINGALSKHADEIYHYGRIRGLNQSSLQSESQKQFKWTDEHRGMMRKLILRMVRLNDGKYSRRKVYLVYKDKVLNAKSLNELNFPDHLDASIEAVIASLEKTRLDASVAEAITELKDRQLEESARKVKAVLDETQMNASYLETSVQEIIDILKARHVDKIVQEVIEVLEGTHLIVRDRDSVGTFVEPMHDSLINHWPKCLTWIEEFKHENLVLQRQIWQAVIEHHKWVPDVYSRPGDTAPLWDNNPKLQQIQLAITDPGDKWLCKKGWGEKSIASMAWLLGHQGELSESQRMDLQDYVWFFGRQQEDDPYYEEIDSGSVFEKIQDQMDAWLNEEELAFVQASFEKQQSEIDRLTQQLEETTRAKEEAEKARERTANEMIEASWKTGTLLPEPQEYEVSGIRALYKKLKLLMSLKKAQSLSPIPIFVKGPHGEDFDTQADEFGYYNPAFLKWARNHVIPAKNNAMLRTLTQPFYDSFMRDMARVYYLVYHYLRKHADFRNRVAQEYIVFCETEEVVSESNRRMGYFGGGNFFIRQFGSYANQHEQWLESHMGSMAIYHWDVAAGFWIRRQIDTTSTAFFEILEELLQTYDPDWLKDVPVLPE
ncbi:MAG: caspase family protein [Bacteroidota bacterium]